MIKVAFFVKDPGNYLIPLWTTFSGLSFALSGTVQEFVSSCVFVFAQHPYDVNDWVKVMDGDNKTMKLKVKDIRLMNTTFHRKDESNIVLIPHNKISKERIENLSRWKYHTKGSVETISLSLEPQPANERNIDAQVQTGNKSKPQEDVRRKVELPETVKTKAKLAGKDKKSEIEEHVQNRVQDFVLKTKAPPIRRYYRMPLVKAKPVLDEEQKMQLEIKFVSKKLVRTVFVCLIILLLKLDRFLEALKMKRNDAVTRW